MSELYTENNLNAGPKLSCGTCIDRYVILRLLSTGGFGQVFESVTGDTQEMVAVKIESTTARVQLLYNETSCLRSVNQVYNKSSYTGNEPFLKYYGYGLFEGYRYLVMERCGENLRDLKIATMLNRFSVITSLWILYKMIKSLEMMHAVGWLHRDVKPANFCVGLTNKRSLFTIDFGMSRCYVAEDGSLKPRKENAPFQGTPRYVSMNIHRRKDASRWDDIWSAYYIAVENIVGFLPWRRAGDVHAVYNVKSTCDIDTLKYGHEGRQPHSLKLIHHYLSASIADEAYFYTPPPYKLFLSEIKQDLQRRNATLDSVQLDWMMNKSTQIMKSVPKPMAKQTSKPVAKALVYGDYQRETDRSVCFY